MKRYLLALAFIVGCATVKQTPTPRPPDPIFTPHTIWLPIDIPGDTQLCVDLFESDGTYRWKCYSVATVRIWVNGMKTAN